MMHRSAIYLGIFFLISLFGCGGSDDIHKEFNKRIENLETQVSQLQDKNRRLLEQTSSKNDSKYMTGIWRSENNSFIDVTEYNDGYYKVRRYSYDRAFLQTDGSPNEEAVVEVHENALVGNPLEIGRIVFARDKQSFTVLGQEYKFLMKGSISDLDASSKQKFKSEYAE